jgi:N-acyl-D-amino-acid deacylase
MSGIASTAGAAEPTTEQIRAVVGRALPLIEASTKEYLLQRECFSCHHQAIPVLALTLARGRGFAVDPENLREQLDLTRADLNGDIASYRAGKGQPGGVERAGYALWTLELGDRPPDETTAAVTGFLLTRDAARDHWNSASHTRPPSEASDFTATFVALRGLRAFGSVEQGARIAARVERVRGWLEANEGGDTEDRVFRLRALKLCSADDAVLRAAVERLRATRRDDGGWAQIDGSTSDAYATGTVLTALHQAGGLSTDDDAYRRGLDFLIKTQEPDGSWHVKSRSKPFQTYFESGFPHGKDQFISSTASAWATAALSLALSEADGPKPGPETIKSADTGLAPRPKPEESTRKEKP